MTTISGIERKTHGVKERSALVKTHFLGIVNHRDDDTRCVTLFEIGNLRTTLWGGKGPYVLIMKSKYGSDQREANANLSLNGAKFYGIKNLPYQSQRSIKKFGEPWVRGFPKQAAEEITKKKEICLMADLTFFICHTC